MHEGVALWREGERNGRREERGGEGKARNEEWRKRERERERERGRERERERERERGMIELRCKCAHKVEKRECGRYVHVGKGQTSLRLTYFTSKSLSIGSSWSSLHILKARTPCSMPLR